MPYIASNIPKSIFYSALVSELLRIASSSLLYKDFNEKAMKLLNRMKAKGAQSLRCRKELPKIIRRHEETFANFGKICDEVRFELHIEFFYFTHDTL